MPGKDLPQRSVWQFVILLAILILVGYWIVMMTMNAHPRVAPKVKNGVSQVRVTLPCVTA